MYFPSLCVDNFYNNPDVIREFALSLEFKSTSNMPWPGKRSPSLDSVNPAFFKNFCDKLFSLTFDFKKTSSVKWAVETYFQIVEPDQYSSINQGWIHADYRPYAGVIYLTPGIDTSCGTSLFRPKNPFDVPINLEEKQDMFLNFDRSKTNFYNEKLEKNNSLFEETVNFKNIYNRIITYDGSQYHGVNKFIGYDNRPRLTQVFFIQEVSSDYFPIPASRQILL